jgi:hypothetical protein
MAVVSARSITGDTIGSIKSVVTFDRSAVDVRSPLR